jgi:hypothetical protein
LPPFSIRVLLLTIEETREGVADSTGDEIINIQEPGPTPGEYE